MEDSEDFAIATFALSARADDNRMRVGPSLSKECLDLKIYLTPINISCTSCTTLLNADDVSLVHVCNMQHQLSFLFMPSQRRWSCVQ